MMRALGMTPGQSRVLIRDESVITAAIARSWACARDLVRLDHQSALAGEGIVFTVPWLQVAGLLVNRVLAGVVAAVPPREARCAARCTCAISHE